MTVIVMIDDDDDDCDDKVLCPRNVDDPGQRREAAIAPTLAHIIIVIIVVFHKYLQGALRNTFLFSAGEHPYPASPQPLTPWIMTSQATKQQKNPSWNNDQLQSVMKYAMMKIAFHFCFIGPIEISYIKFDLLMISL